MRKKHPAILIRLAILGFLTAGAGHYVHATPPLDSGVRASETTVQAATITVKGQVIDGTLGDGIPMASVRVKGQDKGVHTDINGSFSIECKVGDVLIISYVGFTDQEITVKDAGPLRIVLQEDAETLETLVVETGYQKIDRRLFTGSASRLEGEDALIDGGTDLGKMLQGKAAGLQVQNVSATFGAAPKIRVRGASSIYGDAKPLWVVDGVVLEDVVDVSADDLSSGNAATLISSAVAGLNTDDIASFEILKDASATALYGARAMNGVIVVTTKKGGAGTTRVSYTGEFTLRQRPSYSEYNILNSAEQMDVYMELYRKGYLNYASTVRSNNAGEFYVMSNLLSDYDPATDSFAMPNTTEAKSAFLKAAAMRNTDWFAELFRNNIQHNHAVSISGGNDKANFYGSLSLFNDPGWSIADKVQRYTANFNIGYKFADNLKLTFNTSNSFRDQTVPGTNSRSFDAYNGVYVRDFDINPFSYALNTSRTMRVRGADDELFYYRRNYAPFNIINELENNTIGITMLDSKFQAELNYQPIKELELTALGSARFVKTSQENRVTERSNKAMAYRATDDSYVIENNRYLYKDPEQVNSYPAVVLPFGGFYDTQDDILRNYYFRFTANYNKTFNEDHIVNVMAGNEVKYADRSHRWNDGYGMQFEKGLTPNTDYHIMKRLFEQGGNYFGLFNTYDRFVAFFATASYSYQGKYTLNLTGRYDGSNLLGRARSARWLPTWNVSGSWNIRETLFPTHQTISRALIRSTYGLTASMGPARNSLPVFYSDRTFRGLSSRDETLTYIDALGNKDLTWEKQYEFNIGADLGLFNNRLSLSLDAYKRNGFDLIGLLITSGIGGQERKLGNSANMTSQGVEFTLNTVNIRTKDFTWSNNLTFSWNENKITKLEAVPTIGSLTRTGGAPREGYPVRSLFSLPFRGLNDAGIPTFWLGDTDSEGNEIVGYKGINFQQNQDLDFLKYEGPIDPTIMGGFDNTFKYKDFSLSLYFTYQAGSVIRLPDDFSAGYSDQSTMPREFLNRWQIPGDELVTDVPGIPSRWRLYDEGTDLIWAYSGYNYSDVRVAKGDFFRLKDITFAYNLPTQFLKDNLGISSASLRFVASNVWLIYTDKKLNGVDPEFANNGGVAMPTPHQYTMTLRLGF
ncbi:MAG: SusC/RagA family TonB-linked outer membrane protein [Porphyromonas sp.]|nr:SusC/RagA family TonB-linked outer membrane protein [Porphyromonas sp.]